jgi:hypothetical protein
MREKYILSQELKEKDLEIVGDKRLSLLGPSSAAGTLLQNVSVVREAMHIKHEEQRLVMDEPEFPYVYTGAENVIGENSSFFGKTDKDYRVVGVVKKYEGLLKGHSNIALYFLYCKKDDSYRVVERKEVENLTEKFGFRYNNEYLDELEDGDEVPKDTVLYRTTSYDEYMNTRNGINARMLYIVSPYVTEDAIIARESFADRVVTNKVSTISIPLNENAMFLNLYGDEDEYKGIPDIGDVIKGNILAATRQIQGNRLFSDLRDNSLYTVNFSSDQVYYADGKVIDISVFCNNRDIKSNYVNNQILRYLNDEKIFYTKVYKICKRIINSGSTNIHNNIRRWMRNAINRLDDEARWTYNDNIFSNLLIEILVSRSEPISVGRKVAGRYGNKTVSSKIWKDEDMPFTVEETTVDEFGRVQPVGPRRPVDIITNPLAIINRTIAGAPYENSITFITDRVRNKMAEILGIERIFDPEKLKKDKTKWRREDSASIDEAEELLFDVIKTFNPKQYKTLTKEYRKLSDKEKDKTLYDAVQQGIYVQQQPHDDQAVMVRDALIDLYERYPEMLKPIPVFIPKNNWGRDVYIGDHVVGYQYILLLKQDGEKGFSARSAGSISDESLPEKSNENKIAKLWHSETPIRFGEYESPNFMVITKAEVFALISALYRTSPDGRRFMYEAIITGDTYDIPDNFTSRTAEILEVYLKSLGVRMKVVDDDKINFIGEDDDNDVTCHKVKNGYIFASKKEMYYLKKVAKAYKRVIKGRENQILDIEEVWDKTLDSLPFKKKHLTKDMVEVFMRNLELFTS